MSKQNGLRIGKIENIQMLILQLKQNIALGRVKNYVRLDTSRNVMALILNKNIENLRQ